jgi:hypothetical protein
VFGEGGIGEVCHLAVAVRGTVRNKKTSSELECTPRWQIYQYQNSGSPSTGIPEIMEIEASITEI